MGCDIHMWVERREADGKWHLVPDAKVYGHRNYVLFGFLAGVRGDGPAIVEPRGWPEDMSKELLDYMDKSDTDSDEIDRDMRLDWVGYHTPSWLTVEELEKALAVLPEGIGKKAKDFFGEYDAFEPRQCQLAFRDFKWEYVMYWSALAQDNPKNVRIVFNFDS